MSLSCYSSSSPRARTSRAGEVRSGVGSQFAVATPGRVASPSRRRRRTALGMVSDRPFRAPQAEELEETDFGTLGLLNDLVGAMGEFGERERERQREGELP